MLFLIRQWLASDKNLIRRASPRGDSGSGCAVLVSTSLQSGVVKDQQLSGRLQRMAVMMSRLFQWQGGNRDEEVE